MNNVPTEDCSAGSVKSSIAELEQHPGLAKYGSHSESRLLWLAWGKPMTDNVIASLLKLF